METRSGPEWERASEVLRVYGRNDVTSKEAFSLSELLDYLVQTDAEGVDREAFKAGIGWLDFNKTFVMRSDQLIEWQALVDQLQKLSVLVAPERDLSELDRLSLSGTIELNFPMDPMGTFTRLTILSTLCTVTLFTSTM